MRTSNIHARIPSCDGARTRIKFLSACAALVAAGATGAAQADTVNLNYTGAGSGRMVRASLGAQSWNVFAGRLIHNTAGGTAGLAGLPSSISTFCVDILQGQASAPSSYSSSSIATLSGNTGLTNLGFAKQQAIYDLYQAANGRQFTGNLDHAAAFQLALWEVVYDYSATLPGHGLNLIGGNFRATSAGQITLSAAVTVELNYLLASVGIGASSHGLVGFRSGPYQDQLYADPVLVPLPLAVWPALGGLGLVAVKHWRRRQRAVAMG
jgi:hypothetical protein